MKRILFLAVLLAAVSCAAPKPVITWQKYKMDGHRTGVTMPSVANVPEALGTVAPDGYKAPSGTIYKDGSTPAVAQAIIEAQPAMAHLKEVLGHSERGMVKHKPESGLSNFIADELLLETAAITGRKVDLAIMNFGGIRVDMPRGDVLKDDIVSMLPFNNKICYVALKGSDVRAIFEYFAATAPQAVAGVRFTAADGKLLSIEVGGAPLDDDALYGVATIDFLLDGGDNLFVARNAKELIMTDECPREMLIKSVRRLTAEGRTVDFDKDGRASFTKKKKK